MIGLTFVIGPALLAWVGADNAQARWLVVALLAVGLAWSTLIPPLPPDHDGAGAGVGARGLLSAMRAQPVIMLAGFVGGFFELGLASILPLFGLTLGLGTGAAALLVSVSGLGGTLAALPAGMLADRFASPAQGRRTLMAICVSLILLSTCALPWSTHQLWLIWPMVGIWGAAGGALYTLAMIDIGARDKGMALVNATAVLVLSYTLGGLVASSASGALLEVSFPLGFPALLMTVAAIGLAALLGSRHTTPA